MPAKNRYKIYFENGFYHVYNRGVEKRDIFLDDQDYSVFISLLKKYLSPKPHLTGNTGPTRILPVRNYETLVGEIDLLCYCLMPNHFHLLLQQKKIDSMTKLLRRVTTSYSSYFNKKYLRVGPLFQGNYKAIDIENESYLLYLSCYIHRNPLAITRVGPVESPVESLKLYPYSSYQEYLGLRKTSWVKTDLILSYFDQTKKVDPSLRKLNSYEGFVTDFSTDIRQSVDNLALD